jgi:hypothetical protein
MGRVRFKARGRGLWSQRLDKDFGCGAQSQAHFLAFDGKKASLTGAQHTNFATAADAEFFETVEVFFFPAQVDDHPFGFRCKELDGNGLCGWVESHGGGWVFDVWRDNSSRITIDG